MGRPDNESTSLVTQRARQRDLSVVHGAVLGIASALVPLLYLRGFTVDDALILARYASHWARGLGYRFNPHGPQTDGVTPLGFPILLAPFAKGGTLAAFRAARFLGASSWLIASGVLGAAVASSSRCRSRWFALAIVAASAPVAAWSVSGMETGVALGLATMAICLPCVARNAAPGAALAGLVAWLRPEALPFAVVMGVGRMRSATGVPGKVAALALGVLPFSAASIVRQLVWGRPYPLAVLAKPSDLQHGLSYSAASVLLSAGVVVLAAPCFWRELGPWPRTVVLAALAHMAAVALVGGDWMPLSRLFVPIVPAFVLIAAHELSASRGLTGWGARWGARWGAIIVALSVSGELFAMYKVGPAAAQVLTSRRALMAAAAPVIGRFSEIASVDVGWVGASTEADIVDLAGVTDPEIAALPGGHTSKRVTATQLAARGVECILIWLDPSRLGPAPLGTSEILAAASRSVERNLLADLEIQRSFALEWMSPADLPIRYALLARTDRVVPPCCPSPVPRYP